MRITLRAFRSEDVPQMRELWNEVVREGIAFPQTEELSLQEAESFFASQSVSAVAEQEDGTLVGLYILHPNNVGRCGHIANASYAVASTLRGAHIGEQIVLHSLAQAAECGFRILQFNAVVRTNEHARHLYERLGFVPLGIIPGGFKMAEGRYEDIVPYYHLL